MADIHSFCGTWRLMRRRSSDIGRFSSLSVEIGTTGSSPPTLQVKRLWGQGGFSHEDRRYLVLDGRPHTKQVIDTVVPESAMMNLRYDDGAAVKTTAEYLEPEGVIAVRETAVASTSQGTAPLTVEHTLSVGAENDVLSWTVRRSTRPESHSFDYVLKKTGVKEACVMELPDQWAVADGLDTNALLISLQGVVNRHEPLLYFVYPEEWDYRFTRPVLEFLTDVRNYTFTTVLEPGDAIAAFADKVDGYVVWDREVRTSLIVAFTAAGLHNAVVVSERHIPLAEAAGLRCVEDLRNIYRDQSDAEIYAAARERYWSRCNKDYAVWLGGNPGPVMRPGVADWGVANRCFFTDLSTNPECSDEYALAADLLADLNDGALIFGWHSYRKDTEEQHVTLCSRFGHRVEGLHTLPNMSFCRHIPVSPGFEFRNNHTVAPDQICTPTEKVYVSCVQTDCLGVGAWTEQGRGEIPYAWEVTMNWVRLAPAMMEFFYTQATPNDYFIGALSGPGYMYPKAVPADKLPPLLERAAGLMDELDLRVFEVMDYSEGFFHIGNADLPRRIIDAYYDAMPSALGFINGYGPARTFAMRDGRPFVSFDYYVHPTTPEPVVTADLEELAALNPARPYFMLVHVRNFSDIQRVVRILNGLGEEFEVVALDRFLRMAAARPTFCERQMEG